MQLSESIWIISIRKIGRYFKNLHKPVAFFTKLSYTFNPRFTDETAVCMIVAEDQDLKVNKDHVHR